MFLEREICSLLKNNFKVSHLSQGHSLEMSPYKHLIVVAQSRPQEIWFDQDRAVTLHRRMVQTGMSQRGFHVLNDDLKLRAAPQSRGLLSYLASV